MIVKICGITDVEETEYLNENNVDMAGMVLYFPKSKRNITLEKAKEIMASLNENIKKVAVVVSPSIEQVKSIENDNGVGKSREKIREFVMAAKVI